MKKFNADGGFRKDTIKEYNEHDLNSYSGQSLEDTTKSLDDTILLSEEELKELGEIMDEQRDVNPDIKKY